MQTRSVTGDVMEGQVASDHIRSLTSQHDLTAIWAQRVDQVLDEYKIKIDRVRGRMNADNAAIRSAFIQIREMTSQIPEIQRLLDFNGTPTIVKVDGKEGEQAV